MDELKLNAEQQEAAALLVSFLTRESAGELVEGVACFGLYGYAGTGKTTALAHVLSEHPRLRRNIIACAPTHKAAGVLASKMRELGFADVECSTLHSAIGMRRVTRPDDKGNRPFVPTLANAKRKIGHRRIMVIDECSMIAPAMWGHVLETARTLGLRIVVMGDRLQLPPVVSDEEEGPVDESPACAIAGAALTRVMRNTGAVSDTVAGVRDLIDGMGAYPLAQDACHGGTSVVRYTDARLFMDVAADAALAGEDSYVLAYTNAAVDHVNAYITARLCRELGIAEDTEHFEGQQLVSRGAVSDAATVQNPTRHNTNGELIIPTQHRFVVAKVEGAMQHGIPAWRITPRGQGAPIFVCQRASVRKMRKEAQRLKGLALAANGYKASAAWGDYYAFEEGFASVRPAFAGTVHTAQGETIRKTFVLEREIVGKTRGRRDLRGKLLYVAYSRASRELHVLGGAYGE